MLYNFLKVAFRNLARHKGFSFINIAGLTLSVTACLLIGLFIHDEKQYDKFLPDADRVYRIYNERTDNQGSTHVARTPPRFASALQQYPAVEKTVRIMDLQSKSLFEEGNKQIYEEHGLATAPDFFEIFRLPFKYGGGSKALDDLNAIVLTEALAEKYFGPGNPVGRQIMVDKAPFIVKGVVKNTEGRFHLRLTYIIPLAGALKLFQIEDSRMQSWGWQQFYTYIKLRPGADVNTLQSRFQEQIRQEAHPVMKPGGSTYLPFFQALKAIHLHSTDFKTDIAVKGNSVYVRALTIVAVFILLIACFNFINLATARSLQRAKEVGVRKSVGANRRQLILQYIGETILLSCISVLIAVVLSMLLLPLLNRFTEKHISFAVFSHPFFLLLLLALALATGILAGLYPALVLSAFQPVKVLKGGKVGLGKPGSVPWVRHGLVITQFTLSALLIVSVIVVFRQVSYLHNKDLGFSKEQILFFPMRGDQMFRNYEAFKHELLQSSGVSSVAIGYGFPGDIFAMDDIIVPRAGEQKTYPVVQLIVDHDYVKTLGLQIIAGRDFSKDISTDKDRAFLINETAVKELGYGTPDKAIGQPLMWKVWDAKTPDSLKKGAIVGVVKDFHYKSLYDKVNTTVMQIYPPAYWKVAVKMKTAGIASTMDYIKQVWLRSSPDYPMEYKFLDESFELMYKSEDKLKTLLSIFTAIAIFVGCLGLFGLAAYSAERRTKEIGIRKVLGASVNGLVLLLSKEFIRLVVVALLIASPVAWYSMNAWLQDFAYRVRISWWMFVLAGVLSVIIALLTVIFQAIKAANINPARSLRTE